MVPVTHQAMEVQPARHRVPNRQRPHSPDSLVLSNCVV
jgi:hypothetical protein